MLLPPWPNGDQAGLPRRSPEIGSYAGRNIYKASIYFSPEFGCKLRSYEFVRYINIYIVIATFNIAQ